MSRIVFLLEEDSMKVLLEGLLPRLFPNLPFLCVAHEGKTDLERSIPRKLRAWQEPGAHFVIVCDKDGGDCVALKQQLVQLCESAGRPDTLVRIACHELEAWYLGDLDALAQVFGDDSLSRLKGKARYRDPDAIPRPSGEVERLVPEFQKVSGARLMANALTREGNRSHSFRVLLEGIDRLVASLDNQ